MNPEERRQPYLIAHRHANALVLSGYHRDEHAVLRVRHPLGAPLAIGRRNRLVDGCTEIAGRAAWSDEVRVFLADGPDATVRCHEPPQLMHGVRRRLLIFDARGATLRFLVEPGYEQGIRILRDPHFPYFTGDFVEPQIELTRWGPVITIAEVNEDILIEW